MLIIARTLATEITKLPGQRPTPHTLRRSSPERSRRAQGERGWGRLNFFFLGLLLQIFSVLASHNKNMGRVC